MSDHAISIVGNVFFFLGAISVIFFSVAFVMTQAIQEHPMYQSLVKHNQARYNLGCGNEILPDYINADNASYGALKSGVVHLDLNQFPWPIKTGEADEIYMKHVLEHLPDTTLVLKEVLRVLKINGHFRGIVPYIWNRQCCHWQHIKMFTEGSFRAIEIDFPQFKVIKASPKTVCHNWKHFIRNLIPFRGILSHFILGMYDYVEFDLVKVRN